MKHETSHKCSLIEISLQPLSSDFNQKTETPIIKSLFQVT